MTTPHDASLLTEHVGALVKFFLDLGRTNRLATLTIIQIYPDSEPSVTFQTSESMGKNQLNN
jgi:hypothetical protein